MITASRGWRFQGISGLVQASILDFVRITGAGDADLNSVWQIVEVNDQDDLTINLPYDILNNYFSGYGTVLLC